MRDWDPDVDGDIDEHRRRHRLPLKFRRSKRGDTLFVDVQVHQRPTFNRPRPTPPENVTGYFFWLTVKRHFADPDGAALAQVTSNSSTPAGGLVTLVNAPLGQVEFAVPPAATVALAPVRTRLFYDVQLQDLTGAIRTTEEGIWEVDADVTEAIVVPPAPSPTTPSGGYVLVDGPAVVLAVPNTVYVCDVTGGNVVIELPPLLFGLLVGVIAAAGNYGPNSITVVPAAPQKLSQPAPNNTAPPATSYVIGGPASSTGGGALDAGTGLTWVNGGISNVLTLL